MNWRDRFGPNPDKTSLDEPYRDLKLEALVRLLRGEIERGADLDELERKIRGLKDVPQATEALLKVVMEAREKNVAND